MIEVLLFSNGNVAVCRNNDQIPELQEPWITEIFKRLQKAGIDPTNHETCQILMPSGRTALPFMTSEGKWNWEIK